MTPFEGAPSLTAVATRKGKRETKPGGRHGPLGSTAPAVYELAAEILAIRDRFEREISRFKRRISEAEPTAKHPGTYLGKRALDNLPIWRRDLEYLEAHRKRFETQLVEDPILAVQEVNEIQPSHLFAPPPLKKNAIRDMRLKRAVEAVYAWLRFQDHAMPDDGLDRHPKYKQAVSLVAYDPEMVLRALAPVAVARPLKSMRALHALIRHATVQARLETAGAGHKHAAIALVALASGEGEQTVKRAAGS